jgi:hypothetical protein
MPRRPMTIGDFIAVEARQMHFESSSTGLRYRVGREDRAYGQHPKGAYAIFGLSSSASLHWQAYSILTPLRNESYRPSAPTRGWLAWPSWAASSPRRPDASITRPTGWSLESGRRKKTSHHGRQEKYPGSVTQPSRWPVSGAWAGYGSTSFRRASCAICSARRPSKPSWRPVSITSPRSAAEWRRGRKTKSAPSS